MIFTNALLTAGIAAVSNFCSIVGVPRDSTPTAVTALKSFTFGGHAETDVYLIDVYGHEFWIEDGVVARFRTATTYLESLDRSKVEIIAVDMRLTPEDVRARGEALVRRLAFSSVLTNISCHVRQEGEPARRVPFYLLSWPLRTPRRFMDTCAALMEMDGRSGALTLLEVNDPGFFPLKYAQGLRTEASVAGSTPWTPLNEADGRQHIETNELLHAVQTVSLMARALKMPLLENAGISDINLQGISCSTNTSRDLTETLCTVPLRNGAWFQVVNGIPFCLVAPDAFFSRPWQLRSPADRLQFSGSIRHNWHDLALRLQNCITQELDMQSDLITGMTALSCTQEPKLASSDFKRMLIEWRAWPKNANRDVTIAEASPGFEAEFDLETGEIKSFRLNNPQLIFSLKQFSTRKITGR